MEKMRNDSEMITTRRPLISVITVVLNGGDALETAIKSVVCRKNIDYEYIIVDGGSTDGSVGIIKKYESKSIHWISEPDNGVYDAMNKAVSLARGKWFYFLGADDQLLNGFDEAANYLKNEKTLYYGNVYRPNTGRIYDGKFSAYKIACRNICHQSIFYPKSVWDKYAYNLKYPIFADYELNLRCFIDVDFIFEYIPVTIAVFSDKFGISATQADAAFEKDKLLLIRNNFPLWIYLSVLSRSFLIKMLAGLGIQEGLTTMYHNLIGVRPDCARDHKKNSH